jgi:catalase
MKKTFRLLPTRSQLPSTVLNFTAKPRGSRAVSGKFPDMIHAFKPDPVTNRQEAWRFFDFVAAHPESILGVRRHEVEEAPGLLAVGHRVGLEGVDHVRELDKSPWGIPANYREMEGSGVNTYKLVNDQGVAHLCKFHFIPKICTANSHSGKLPAAMLSYRSLVA